MPALLTRMFSFPAFALTVSTATAQSPSLVTSSVRNSALPPFATMPSTTAFPAATSRSPTKT